MKANAGLALLGAIVCVLSTVPCRAQGGPENNASAQCKELESADFSNVQDAPTQILAADPAAAKGDLPAYCKAQGYVTPQVGFEIWLPTAQWNGKFIEVGCGGNCGAAWTFWCFGPLRKGYACIASDMGHKGKSSDGLWAYNNLQGKIDWAYRATHVVALAGKAVAERYYGRAPHKSYFIGCSTGGRQGLVEAQQFPWDFNGIAAGAPAIDSPGIRLRQLWDVRALLNKGDKPVLSPAAVRLLHDGALAACDLDDGIKDGIIGSPLQCRFDPSVLICSKDRKSNCLTSAQAQAAKAVYAGPMTSNGESIYTGGLEPGSELGWPDLASFGPRIEEFFKYMGFEPDAGPNWKLSDFNFDRDYKRLGGMNVLYSAANPDLRKFKAAGGKLIVYHGWADKAVTPKDSIDYYDTVEKTMGGRAATQDFFRLFMVPGMEHCSGGDGAFAVDYLSYLEDWVENGAAPDKMVGAHVQGMDWLAALVLQFPLNASTNVSFTRPLYPYPMLASYQGSGDPNKAESFKAVGQ